jgi:hypothetical protein
MPACDPAVLALAIDQEWRFITTGLDRESSLRASRMWGTSDLNIADHKRDVI